MPASAAAAAQASAHCHPEHRLHCLVPPVALLPAAFGCAAAHAVAMLEMAHSLLAMHQAQAQPLAVDAASPAGGSSCSTSC